MNSGLEISFSGSFKISDSISLLIVCLQIFYFFWVPLLVLIKKITRLHFLAFLAVNYDHIIQRNVSRHEVYCLHIWTTKTSQKPSPKIFSIYKLTGLETSILTSEHVEKADLCPSMTLWRKVSLPTHISTQDFYLTKNSCYWAELLYLWMLKENQGKKLI